MGLVMSKKEFFLQGSLKGGEIMAKWCYWKGMEGTNKYWKGLSGEMDQIAPRNDPCQLSPSPCSDIV